MAAMTIIERRILVFSIWGVLGLLGLGFLLEGFSRDIYAVSLIGIALIVAAFLAHIIVNAVFDQPFAMGETALGIGGFGVLALLFIVGWLRSELSMADYYSGITLFGVLMAGFIAYLATRYGLRSAFSRFHGHSQRAGDGAR